MKYDKGVEMYNVEILSEIFDAAMLLADTNECSVEAIINETIIERFRQEHNALLDFHRECGCGPEVNTCADSRYLIGSYNKVRRNLRPYELGIRCICCGEDVESSYQEDSSKH